MKRVLVIGSCGAGKSTFSRKLHELTDLPLIPLDWHYWKPGWVEPSEAKWNVTVYELVSGDEWIIDGNYGSSLSQRVARADTIIWLDLPRFLCTYRVLRRVFLFRKHGRPDMARGCDERFDWEFMKYVWNFRRDKNPNIEKRIALALKECRVFRLKTPNQVSDFLRQI